MPNAMMTPFMKRWLAGKVKRYHTWNLINDQNVGNHTYGVFQIVLAVHPEMSMELVRAIMDHDAPELRTGDLPYPTKRYKDIGNQVTEIEHKFLSSNPLDNLEFKILKWADMAECMLYCFYELEMGNKTVKEMAKKAVNHMKKMEAEMPSIYQSRMASWRNDLSFDTTELLEPEKWTI